MYSVIVTESSSGSDHNPLLPYTSGASNLQQYDREVTNCPSLNFLVSKSIPRDLRHPVTTSAAISAAVGLSNAH